MAAGARPGEASNDYTANASRARELRAKCCIVFSEGELKKFAANNDRK